MQLLVTIIFFTAISFAQDFVSAACNFQGGSDEELFSKLFTCVWQRYVTKYQFLEKGRNANLQSKARDYPQPGYLLRWAIDINDIRRDSESSLLMSLIDDYKPLKDDDEMISSQTRRKELAVLNNMFNTSLVADVYSTLRYSGILGRVAVDTMEDFRQFVDKTWFSRFGGSSYLHEAGTRGSSGFEHVFAGEIDTRDGISKGLHSWIQIVSLENQNKFDYYGYYDRVNSINLGSIKYGRGKYMKTISSIFFGTPVEFEVMLYTACFISKKNRNCPLKINNQDIIVRTFNVNWQPTSIATAYPIEDENTLL